MAKLRATSVQDSLTIDTISSDTLPINKGLILSDTYSQNHSSVRFENYNGSLNIRFSNQSPTANPSVNAVDCNVNVGKTLSAKSISLPSGEITIDDTFDSNGNLIFSNININKELPKSIAETVQSGDYITLGKGSFTVPLADDIDINKGVSNSVCSNIEDIIYEESGSYFLEFSKIQNNVYTWILKIEDAKGNFVTADVNVKLSSSPGYQNYEISINKTNLNSITFKGPIKKISLNSINSNPTDAEKRALQDTPINIKLKMKRYTAANILIGSYSNTNSVKKII